MINKNLGIIIDAKHVNEGVHYIFADEKNLVSTNGHILFCEPKSQDVESGYYNPVTLQRLDYNGIPFPQNYEKLFNLVNLEKIENPVFSTYVKKDDLKNIKTKKIAGIKGTDLFVNLDYLKKALQYIGEKFTMSLDKANKWQPILFENDKGQKVLLMPIKSDINNYNFIEDIQPDQIKQVVKFKNCYVVKKDNNILGVFTKKADALQNADSECEIIETILK